MSSKGEEDFWGSDEENAKQRAMKRGLWISWYWLPKNMASCDDRHFTVRLSKSFRTAID